MTFSQSAGVICFGVFSDIMNNKTRFGLAQRRNLTGESGRDGDDNEHQNPAGPRKRYDSHLRLT